MEEEVVQIIPIFGKPLFKHYNLASNVWGDCRFGLAVKRLCIQAIAVIMEDGP